MSQLSSPRPSKQGPELFTSANNAQIHGSQFTAVGVINNLSPTQPKDPFQLLYGRVSTSAFHSSATLVDPPRCHENTRIDVMNDIFSWILEDKMRKTWILWLTGAAGAGKTAIGQSLAELCVAQGVPVASFFFFPADSARSRIEHVVATLAYQLIQLVPIMKPVVLEAIESNPLIFEQSFETQLDELIMRPLSLLKESHLSWKLLIIIDGIDECEGEGNQINMIRTFAKILGGRNLPLILMFSSRVENRFKMAFNISKVDEILVTLTLDDKYQADDDIRLFVNDAFSEIKRVHPFCHLLPSDWPGTDPVEEIVSKSSGQFIYASVTTNFLSLPDENPSEQLEIIRGLRLSGAETPFAQLDTLFRHIFSRIRNIELVKCILAYVILGDDPNVIALAGLIGRRSSDVDVALSGLTSVITIRRRTEYEAPSIIFLHASLPDFLLDQTRSREYHIDAGYWATYFSNLWLKKVASGRIEGIYYSDNREAIPKLLQQANPTAKLREHIMQFTPTESLAAMLPEFVKSIQKLDFGDEGEAHQHQLALSVRLLWDVNPGLIGPFIEEENDLSEIMATIGDAIDEGHNNQELIAEQESDAHKTAREMFEKKEAARRRKVMRRFDEQEAARQRALRESFDVQEALRREAARQAFEAEENSRRQAERATYEAREELRREKERLEYETKEAARREAEMKKLESQEMEKREQWRREFERIQFEAREEARRDAERRTFDIEEQERRAAARREFDEQEALRRQKILQAFQSQNTKSKTSFWSRLKRKS